MAPSSAEYLLECIWNLSWEFELKFLLILSFVLSANAMAKDYIVLGISGFGTAREGKGQPSGVHDNLPIHGSNVRQYFKLVHKASTKELQEVIDQFDCRNGKQADPQLGFILMVNSWGAPKGYKISEMYQKQCGRKIDIAYSIDGVTKPIGPFKKAPIAQQCFSYYQSKGAIHGVALNGCTNVEYTDSCNRSSYGPIQCHIAVEWWGSERAKNELLRGALR